MDSTYECEMSEMRTTLGGAHVRIHKMTKNDRKPVWWACAISTLMTRDEMFVGLLGGMIAMAGTLAV